MIAQALDYLNAHAFNSLIALLGFLLTIGLLVTFHEYGHYRIAKACGVKVLRFSIGFGKVLYTRTHGPDHTEFVLSKLPLGGYVRMLDEREGPVDPSEAHRAFNRQKLWKRAAIVSAGPVANLLLAVVLYAGASWIGVDEPKAVVGTPPPSSLAAQAGLRGGDLVTAYSTDGIEWQELRSFVDLRWELTRAILHSAPLYLRVVDAGHGGTRTVMVGLDTLDSRDIDASTMNRIGFGVMYGAPTLGNVTPEGPAARAGLRRGDRIVSVDGKPVTDVGALIETIRANVGAAPAARSAGRDESNAEGPPPVNDGDAASSASGSASAAAPGPAGPAPMRWIVERAGQPMTITVTPELNATPTGRVARVGTELGVGRPQMVMVRYGPIDGLQQAVSRTWDMSSMTLQMMGRMVAGQVSLKNLSGPITIAEGAGRSIQLGLSDFLIFLAVVSVSLGVLNLLPLPMLDGGHLMYYLFEAVTGRPVSDAWLERLQRGGVVIMLMMMSLAFYNDMARQLGFQ